MATNNFSLNDIFKSMYGGAVKDYVPEHIRKKREKFNRQLNQILRNRKIK